MKHTKNIIRYLTISLIISYVVLCSVAPMASAREFIPTNTPVNDLNSIFPESSLKPGTDSNSDADSDSAPVWGTREHPSLNNATGSDTNTTNSSSNKNSNSNASANNASNQPVWGTREHPSVNLGTPDSVSDSTPDSSVVSEIVQVLNNKTFYTYSDPDNEKTRINVLTIGEKNYMILPSAVSPKKVVLYAGTESAEQIRIKGALGEADFTSGAEIDLTWLCNPDDYTVKFSITEDRTTFTYELTLLFSKNISSVHLTSLDPIENGREWVESSEDKSNKATGSMVMQKSNGELVYDGDLTQIKGRGNTTWQLPKKPYQIKLKKSTDLLETGIEKNKSKTWVLLANALDPALVRNSIALNLGNALGMEMNIDGVFVDLYYDGEYRGNYMLTEKVEIGVGRVDISDLEKENENTNSSTIIENRPSDTSTTANGAFYKYFTGLKSPDDITGGYLLEMDYEVRALEEMSYFRTKRGQYVVVKSPEYATRKEMDYIASLYQEYEDAVYNKGKNPTTGKLYSDYMDVDSIARYYLVHEFSKARDCFKSSAYIYKEAGTDKMSMGPLWDYDMSFGKGGADYTKDDTPLGIIANSSEFAFTILKIDDFYNRVKALYETEFYPLIQDVVLGDKNATSSNGALHSLSYYADLVSDSAALNAKIWPIGKSHEEVTAILRDFITRRAEYLKELFHKTSSAELLSVHKYSDVRSTAWYYIDVTTASSLGFVQGLGESIFAPEDKVTRAQMAQVLYNLSGKQAVEYKEHYSDVSETDWYATAVTWATNVGLLQPVSGNLLEPAQNVTREEFALFLYKHQNSPEVESDNLSKFDDAASVTDSARNAFEWALSNGILTGYETNCLEPQRTMTRAEFATILVRYYNKVLNSISGSPKNTVEVSEN